MEGACPQQQYRTDDLSVLHNVLTRRNPRTLIVDMVSTHMRIPVNVFFISCGVEPSALLL
jgi:hypothetical protein